MKRDPQDDLKIMQEENRNRAAFIKAVKKVHKLSSDLHQAKQSKNAAVLKMIPEIESQLIHWRSERGRLAAILGE